MREAKFLFVAMGAAVTVSVVPLALLAIDWKMLGYDHEPTSPFLTPLQGRLSDFLTGTAALIYLLNLPLGVAYLVGAFRFLSRRRWLAAASFTCLSMVVLGLCGAFINGHPEFWGWKR
jgi:hypothetical protein